MSHERPPWSSIFDKVPSNDHIQTPRKLRDILVRSDFKTPWKMQKSSGLCCRNCSNCRRMTRTNLITSRSNGYSYTITDSLSCRLQYVIYLIECRKCGLQYVGQTLNNLSVRLTQYMSDIKTKKDTSILGLIVLRQTNHGPTLPQTLLSKCRIH